MSRFKNSSMAEQLSSLTGLDMGLADNLLDTVGDSKVSVEEADSITREMLLLFSIKATNEEV